MVQPAPLFHAKGSPRDFLLIGVMGFAAVTLSFVPSFLIYRHVDVVLRWYLAATLAWVPAATAIVLLSPRVQPSNLRGLGLHVVAALATLLPYDWLQSRIGGLLQVPHSDS